MRPYNNRYEYYSGGPADGNSGLLKTVKRHINGASLLRHVV
jgi:hypothetical protein